VSTYRDRVQALLTRRLHGATLDELVRETGWQRRSVEVILSRARNGRLGRPGWAWTEAQDAVIERWWATENSLQIARRLQRLRPGVSHWAVNSRARRLGLVKSASPVNWKTEMLGL
jgi:hypothetical protein